MTLNVSSSLEETVNESISALAGVPETRRTLYDPYIWGLYRVGYLFLPRYVIPGLLFNVEVFFPVGSGLFHPIFFFTGFQCEYSLYSRWK